MSDLGTDCVETVVGFIDAWNRARLLALEYCRPELHDKLRFELADVSTRAGQVKAHVLAKHATDNRREERTLQQVQAERAVRVVSAFPDHPVAPPPENYQEMVPE